MSKNQGIEYSVPGLMNSVWRNLPEQNRNMDYPADFWLHDQELIQGLQVGDTLVLRVYSRGTHIWEWLGKPGSIQAYLFEPCMNYHRDWNGSFPGSVRFVRITRDENFGRATPQYSWGIAE